MRRAEKENELRSLLLKELCSRLRGQNHSYSSPDDDVKSNLLHLRFGSH